uniref:Uncharacterized protein n=1 Tax=Arion vulgaris TaxID=1028688 RepID=A0A0B7BQD9_9EUPU
MDPYKLKKFKKLECVNHVHKRMGETALCKLAKDEKLELGGRGVRSLTGNMSDTAKLLPGCHLGQQ